MFPPREDIPLPTQPPYTAFIGNLAFDLTEQDLESFFGSFQVHFHVNPILLRLLNEYLSLRSKM